MAHAPCADKARNVLDILCPECKTQQTPVPKHNALQFCVRWFPVNRTEVLARRGDTT